MAIKPDPKRPGTFIVSYGKRHPITRQTLSLRRRGFKSKAEAKRAYDELVIEVNDRLRGKLVPTWEAAVANLGQSQQARGLSGKTIDDYAISLRAHTFPDWRERLIDSITTEEIRNLLQAKLGDRHPNTRRNVHKFIRAAFEVAVERGDLQRNPSPRLTFRAPYKIKGVLTKPQVTLLLEKAKLVGWEWYPHVALALYTGMRNGELYALTWDKVNLEARQILVDCSWSSKDGLKSTKSGDDRIVEIAPELLPMLARLKLQSDGSSSVLPRLSRWEAGAQASELQAFLLTLGLPRIRFHDLRATWCTLMLSKGVEPVKLMAMGGWRDLKTIRHYLRISGVSIQGITDGLSLHNPSPEAAEVVQMHRSL